MPSSVFGAPLQVACMGAGVQRSICQSPETTSCKVQGHGLCNIRNLFGLYCLCYFLALYPAPMTRNWVADPHCLLRIARVNVLFKTLFESGVGWFGGPKPAPAQEEAPCVVRDPLPRTAIHPTGFGLHDSLSRAPRYRMVWIPPVPGVGGLAAQGEDVGSASPHEAGDGQIHNLMLARPPMERGSGIWSC